MKEELIIQIDERLQYMKKSRKWLAEQIGMTQENLSRIMNGKQQASEEVLNRIASALDKDLVIYK